MTEIKGVGNPPRPRVGRLRHAAIIAALLAGTAIGAGATAIAHRGRCVTYVALTPARIAAMKDGTPIAIEGDVAEVFGNKFILQDPSGRALVETGRRGEDRDLVVRDEKVTVQGRFDHGFVHGIEIRHADGRSDPLDPPPPRSPEGGPNGPALKG